MDAGSIRIRVVVDYVPWRRLGGTEFHQRPGLQILRETFDGFEAVEQAEQLRPDLILLDIGMPKLNGIEAARRIREVSPTSKILFISENRSRDIVEEALRTGAAGYMVKSDAASDLLPAIEAVLEGKRFISASLGGHIFGPTKMESETTRRDTVVASAALSNTENICPHAVGFYADDRRLLTDLTQFVGAALNAGNSAIIVATESHRNNLLPRLQADGVDIDKAIEQGRYVALDAAETLSEFVVKGVPDPVRFLDLVGDLIVTATEAARGEHPHVSIFGECVDLLWIQGNRDAAIQVEKLANHLSKIHSVSILCAYSLPNGQEAMDSHFFRKVCAEHTAVYSE